ncbi:hypothetical protein KI387_013511, partial [Taxus chinensis]
RPEEEEETGVEEGATRVDTGKCVKTLGGRIEKETNPSTPTGVGVTVGEETMGVEGICEMREEMLGDRSMREEKMEEEGAGMVEDGGEDTKRSGWLSDMRRGRRSGRWH